MMSTDRVTLRELALRDRNGLPCWCGRPQGHAGWLVCVEDRANEASNAPLEQEVHDGS